MKIQNHGYCAKGQCQRFQKFNWFKETFHLLNKRTCKVISEIYEDVSLKIYGKMLFLLGAA